jgi:formylglycine-generating enzyme
MVYIRKGSFNMGASDETPNKDPGMLKTVSVNSFWMDDTEITNSEYQQYIQWVTDSVAAYLTFANGLDYYKAKDRSNNVIIPEHIDWLKLHEIWRDNNSEIVAALEPLYYQGKEVFKGKKEIDYRKIFYSYSYVDYQKAAERANSYNYKTQSYDGGIKDRSDFFVKDLKVAVYPDTLVWIRDFTYSYNDPWTLFYFWHPAFVDYPVVGVTWEQANAFCHWRTKIKEDFLVQEGIPSIHPYRLPTEAEWEYAARGGKLNSTYPWGGYYTLSQKGCYLANFKPKRGNYVADSRTTARTMKVGTFDPNPYGLYDMAGNVSEWTATAYDYLSYQQMNELNPHFQYNASDTDVPALKRKVVRGGSWKDVAYYLQVSTRDFNYQDSANCFTGFRCVMNAIEDNSKKSIYE